MMPEITLTSGETTFVDDEDYDYLRQFTWSLNYPNGYVHGYVAEQVQYMHHVVLARQGIARLEHTDHDDRNKLNNRRGNLKPVTCSQNHQNKGMQRNNISGFIGVTWYARTSRWRAAIQVNGRQIHIGYFDTPEQASAAYQRAKGRLHGAKSSIISQTAPTRADGPTRCRPSGMLLEKAVREAVGELRPPRCMGSLEGRSSHS